MNLSNVIGFIWLYLVTMMKLGADFDFWDSFFIGIAITLLFAKNNKEKVNEKLD